MRKHLIFKHTITLLLMIMFSLALTQMIPGKGITFESYAASVKKTTKKAKKEFRRKLDEISNEGGSTTSYRIVNIVGNNVPELLVDYSEEGERHGTFTVYAYKNGKVKQILSDSDDNMEVYIYKKTSTLVLYNAYHGYVGYSYYKYSGGKFRLKAVDCYNDAAETPHWYENANRDHISKAKFNKITKKLKKGKKKDLDYEHWGVIYTNDI